MTYSCSEVTVLRIAIFENIMTPGGHEVDYDRILVEELKALGHEVIFYVPENFVFHFDYQGRVPVVRLQGKVLSYTGLTGLKKSFTAVKREFNRQSWYKQLYQHAKQGDIDAIIVPTCTYRYLRALRYNPLKNSPVPVLFILHGIIPKDKDNFFKEVAAVEKYPNIRPVVMTIGDQIFGRKPKNVKIVYPPTYIPRDIDYQPEFQKKDVLKIGFFGQYRREKNLEGFLEIFVKGNYTKNHKLLVQGATMRPEDAEDFERIIKKYSGHDNIEFLHKGLWGADWQQAIADSDALLMPYSAERYRYQCSAMYFTAIGFQKPSIVSDDMNPEILEKFTVGSAYKSGDQQDLAEKLANFINTYDEKAEQYAAGLRVAAEEFAPQVLACKLVETMK